MLAPERIKNLANKCAGMSFSLIPHEARCFWHGVFRHVKCAKGDVDARKHHGEILIHGVASIGMVPTVLDRAYQNIAKWTKRPSRIGMYEEIPSADYDSCGDEHFGISSDQC